MQESREPGCLETNFWGGP